MTSHSLLHQSGIIISYLNTNYALSISILSIIVAMKIKIPFFVALPFTYFVVSQGQQGSQSLILLLIIFFLWKLLLGQFGVFY